MRNWLFTIPLRLRSILRLGRLESELSEEFEFHLLCRVNTEIAAGKTPEEARRAALRAMDGMEQHKESCRDARRVGLVDSVWRDLRYAYRSLWKSPAFTIAATLTLALAIGVNTAMFSVAKGILARPLPYTDPDSLVWISMRLPPWPDASRIMGQDYLEWRKRAGTVAGLAAFRNWDLNLTGVEQPERLNGARVTSSFLALLGVQPALGRSFLQAEDMPGDQPVVILTDALWRRLYRADPAVLGRSIVLDGLPRTIVGVLAPSFEFPGDDAVDLLVPLSIGVEPNWAASEALVVSVLGRLPAGVPPERAAAELRGISRGAPKVSAVRAGLEVGVEPLRRKLAGDNRLTILLLLGASGMILLIACGNVTHLSLVRSLARKQEITIRKALGAHRSRLIRQLLTESAVLTAIGSSAGLLLAVWTLEAVRARAPFGNIGQLGIDQPALWFTIAAAVFTTLASGLGPALVGSRGDLGDVLKGSHGPEGGSRRSPYFLAVTEVSLTIVLLAGAGLLLRSLDRLTSEEPGFEPRNVLTARLAMSRNRSVMPSFSAERALPRAIEDRLAALPGVLNVATSSALPLVGSSYGGPVVIEGRPEASGPMPETVTFGAVSAGYFKTMGIPVIQGRPFRPADLASPGAVVVVNEAFVRRFGDGKNVVGRRLTGPGGEFRRTWRTIVGVAGDVRRYGLAQEPTPEVFLLKEAFLAGETFISIRTATAPPALAAAVRREMASLAPDRPVFDIATMEDRLAKYVSPWRLHAVLLSAFAGLALSMTAVGVYGVMSYQAARRIKELGIRIALGAGRGRLLWLVTRRGTGAVLAGIAVGVGGALALTRYMTHLLYETEPLDPPAFLAAAGGLVAVGLMAVLVPACRALRVDAVKTLREG